MIVYQQIMKKSLGTFCQKDEDVDQSKSMKCKIKFKKKNRKRGEKQRKNNKKKQTPRFISPLLNFFYDQYLYNHLI